MSMSAISLGRMLGRTARRHPTRVALVSQEGVRRTYRELDEQSNSFANGLARMGTGNSDHPVC